MELYLCQFCVTILLVFSSFSAVCGSAVSNILPRRDVSGEIMNVHDGQIVFENGTYYWFAAGYNDCLESPGLNGCAGCAGHAIGPDCGCGFEANTSVNLYTSPDLKNWTAHGNVLPLATRPADTSLFSPRAIFNEYTQEWVLWYNYVPRYSYAVATSKNPFGPFKTVDVNAGASFRFGNSSVTGLTNSNIGDFSLFKDDDGVAYMLYSHDPAPIDPPNASNTQQKQRSIQTDCTRGADPPGCGKLSVARLTPDYLRSSWDPETGEGEGSILSGFEAPSMFKRHGLYYALASSACCYCGQGGKVYVHTSSSPLGPWTEQQQTIDFGTGNTTTQGQQTTVTSVADTEDFIWQGDRWQTAPDNLKSHDFQFWTKLKFEEEGGILPMQWVDEFEL